MGAPEVAIAAVMPKPGADVELREIALPELASGEALMRVECSEVCGTDLYLQQGLLAGVPYPIIPGHVSVGILEKIHGEIRDVYGQLFSEGDRVTFLDVHETCHACWQCLVAKASTRCPHRKVYGITYGLADGLTGGWAEYLHIKPGVHCIRLDEVPTDLFMAGGCSLPTAIHAVDRANIQLGDSVLILGSGPVGLSTVALANLRGAASVLCIGGPENRLACAQQMGASSTLDFTTATAPQREQWVRDRTRNRGVDVTIECTGAPSAVTDAMRCTRDAGTVVIVGQYTDHGEIPFNPHLDLNKKHLDVLGCWGSDYSHFHRGVELLRLERAQLLWGEVNLDRYKLSQVNEALAAIAAGSVVKALVTPIV